MIHVNDVVTNINFPGMSFIWRVTQDGKSQHIANVPQIAAACKQNGFSECFCYPYNFVLLGKLQKPISLWKYEYYQAENIRIYGASSKQYVDMDVKKLKIVCPWYKVRDSNWQKK